MCLKTRSTTSCLSAICKSVKCEKGEHVRTHREQSYKSKDSARSAPSRSPHSCASPPPFSAPRAADSPHPSATHQHTLSARARETSRGHTAMAAPHTPTVRPSRRAQISMALLSVSALRGEADATAPLRRGEVFALSSPPSRRAAPRSRARARTHECAQGGGCGAHRLLDLLAYPMRDLHRMLCSHRPLRQ